MAGNIRIGAGVETPAQSRTSVSGGFSFPARPAPAPQAPVGYGLAYQMGGPNYMYGVTPRYGAYYRDGGTPPGQIYGNFPGAREGADMFGFWPTMFQTSPYATASQMYTPGLGVMPLVGYPSRYPHVIMGGYSDYGAPIANQAMNMMLPLLMMGLYRQMFPMPGATPAAAAGGGGKKGGGGSGGSGGKKEWAATKEGYKFHYPGAEADWDGYASPSTANVPGWGGRVDTVGPMPASPADVVRDIRARDARALADAGALAGAAAGAAFRGSAPAAPVVSAPPAAPRAVDNPVATPAIMRDPLADSGGVGSPSSGGKEQVQRLVDRFNVKNWYNPNF